MWQISTIIIVKKIFIIPKFWCFINASQKVDQIIIRRRILFITIILKEDLNFSTFFEKKNRIICPNRIGKNTVIPKLKRIFIIGAEGFVLKKRKIVKGVINNPKRFPNDALNKATASFPIIFLINIWVFSNL